MKDSKFFNLVLILGALASGILAILQIYDYFSLDKTIEYKDKSIPLVYEDSKKFQEFLIKNSGRTVKFNTQISFDLAVGINQLIHEVCEYDRILDVIDERPHLIEKMPIGLPEFKDGFNGNVEIFPYNEKTRKHNIDEKIASKVSCSNKLRIRVKDPSMLRFSYGGTGIVNLPLNGLFVIEVHHFSGPATEFTLREI